ncbi:hypothetical protein OPT61_g5592 [Boeremia exigua]|uniref:Uncharacterized protein n=1 Tax=Boeremia exigua TaxID=749465 RepID=A0ACC2I9R2_9PLEO|nr:hypothetical protein OPT61_g5592 [Boeremia exigua]
MGGGGDGGDGTRRRSSLQWAGLAKRRKGEVIRLSHRPTAGMAPNESGAETHKSERCLTSSKERICMVDIEFVGSVQPGLAVFTVTALTWSLFNVAE